jgi:hypothetical protein
MPETKCGFNDSPNVSGAELLTAFGPTLIVDIGFDPKYKPDVTKPGEVPVAGATDIQALVDTGARESCIDNLLATTLGLPVVDRRPISGVHGPGMANMYLAQIRVPLLGVTIYGVFAGADLQAGGQMHKALLGRAFLQHFTMIYEGRTGTVTISSD